MRVAALLLAFGVPLAGCGQGAPQQAAPPPPAVTVAKPAKQTVTDYDEYVGRFVAIERRIPASATGLASHGWTDAQAAAFAERCRAAGFVDVAIEHDRHGRRSTVAVVASAP